MLQCQKPCEKSWLCSFEREVWVGMRCALSRCTSPAAVQSQVRTPLFYCDKVCPGVVPRNECRWSTELQKLPAKVRSDAVSCQVCLAMAGGRWEPAGLILQFAGLYRLDPDMFDGARHAIPAAAFELASAPVMHTLLSNIPPLRRLREEQRRACLARTLDWLTSASWILDCWRVRTAEDTRDLCRWEVASRKHLPIPVRALVCDFLCGDLVKGS